MEEVFIKEEIVIKEEKYTYSSDEDDNTVEVVKNPVKKRKIWINPKLMFRYVDGEFVTRFKNLKDNEAAFKVHFGVSYKKFAQLLEMLRPHIEKRNTNLREAISAEERLAVCLRYYSTGTSKSGLAVAYKLGQSTVKKIIDDVSMAIATVLSAEMMPMPTEDTWRQNEEGFRQSYSFPNCVGIIDGREILCYVAPKHRYSLFLLTIVDPSSKFVIVNIGDYSKLTQGGQLNNSMLGRLLNSELLTLPQDKCLIDNEKVLPHVFVATKVFPLKNNVLRSYPVNYKLTDDRKVLNEHLNEALKPSLVAFTMLINHFPVYQSILYLKPDHARDIILATCSLHNFLLDEQVCDIEGKKSISKHVRDLPSYGGNWSASAVGIREQFKNYFLSQKQLQNDVTT